MNLYLPELFQIMYKPALLIGVCMAMLAVVLGAFGAHYLKTIFTPDVLQSFETGVRYQFYHAFALLLVGTLGAYLPGKSLQRISVFFTSGIVLFSGSIYLLCYFKSTGSIGLGGLGVLTPIGGVCFIVGWIMLLITVLRSNKGN
jgi:uncharacterized membrane protein YgdD (TMEM256/DUF423 family)